MDLATGVIAVLGLAMAGGVFVLTRRDASRVGISRPRLWAGAASGTPAVGLYLLLFTTAPVPGVLMTAIAGPVLYAFERDTATEDDGPIRPGQLPNAPAKDDEAAPDSTTRADQSDES